MTILVMVTVPEPFLHPLPAQTSDFDFLQGYFDVRSRRLVDAVAGEGGSGHWVESTATSIARTHFAGAVSIDEMYFPDRDLHGLSLRVFDPEQRRWSVYWVDSAVGVLQPPASGSWDGGSCFFTGEEIVDGRPVLCSYAWSDVDESGGHWEQSLSTDGGLSWELNWEMDFVRRAPPPNAAPARRSVTDFDFLSGRFTVEHHQLDRRLTGSSLWHTSRGRCEAGTYFDGAVSVDEIEVPGDARGMTVRIWNPRTELWSLYWIDSRQGRLTAPVVGRFDRRTNSFVGSADEQLDGRPIVVRFLWSDISADGASWRQAFSDDDGASWETNWQMTFERIA